MKTIDLIYFNSTNPDIPADNCLAINMNNSKTRILVADDDPVYREVAKEALETAGHSVTAAADGVEAIAALAAQQFDTAVIDLNMPKAGGIAVIEAARAKGLNINTPIIVVTGHDDANAIEQAYKAGATSFLTKPLNWVLFTPHVNFVLRSGQVESELRDATAAAAFLSDLKSQMMGALAREFQSPIKTIFGFAELIRKEVYGPLSPPMYREMATDMGNAAQKLNAAFLSLLNFGNSLTEQLQIKTEPVRIVDVIRHAIAKSEDAADRNGVQLIASIEIADAAHLEADPVLLVQAIRSVIGNAVKVAPRGSAVEIHAGIGNNGNFRLWTVDRGPAIPATLMAEINPQAINRSGRSQDFESRDVGIKIAKILTEAHQGRLDMTSDPANGNVVSLDIPKERVLAQRTESTAPSIPSSDMQAQRLAAVSAALSSDPRVRLGRPAEHQAQPVATSRSNLLSPPLTSANPPLPGRVRPSQ